jgi:hypothetical protein
MIASCLLGLGPAVQDWSPATCQQPCQRAAQISSGYVAGRLEDGAWCGEEYAYVSPIMSLGLLSEMERVAWPLSYMELAPFYDKVESFLGVQDLETALHSFLMVLSDRLPTSQRQNCSSRKKWKAFGEIAKLLSPVE